jgi:hypothetical protein
MVVVVVAVVVLDSPQNWQSHYDLHLISISLSYLFYFFYFVRVHLDRAFIFDCLSTYSYYLYSPLHNCVKPQFFLNWSCDVMP